MITNKFPTKFVIEYSRKHLILTVIKSCYWNWNILESQVQISKCLSHIWVQIRQQLVKIDKFQSSSKEISCGVPQWSNVGPLLFLVYINNVHGIALKWDITLYANNTSLLYYAHSTDNVVKQAQQDLDILLQNFFFKQIYLLQIH